MMVMSDASFATFVPSPIDKPTCAALRAGASFVPSPVTATTWCWACKASTNRFLSIGRARAMIFRLFTRLESSSSLRASNSEPVITQLSQSFSVHSPTCRPISFAVPGVSPVTILTSIPASRHSRTAAGTSLRTGSEMATIPWKVNPFPVCLMVSRRVGITPSCKLSSSMSIQAKPNVRIAWFCQVNNWLLISSHERFPMIEEQ